MDNDSQEILLHPMSQQHYPSRFPSLRTTHYPVRKHSSRKPYRYMRNSLPVEPCFSPTIANNEVTFAALDDDGPDYHLGQIYDRYYRSSEQKTRGSTASLTPSFHVHDLRTENSYSGRTQESLDNPQRPNEGHLSADGYLNYHQPGLRHSHSFTESERAFTLDCMRHSDGSLTTENIRNPTQEVWCTCGDDSDDCTLTAVDVEAQQATTFANNEKTAFEVRTSVLIRTFGC